MDVVEGVAGSSLSLCVARSVTMDMRYTTSSFRMREGADLRHAQDVHGSARDLASRHELADVTEKAQLLLGSAYFPAVVEANPDVTLALVVRDDGAY